MEGTTKTERGTPFFLVLAAWSTLFWLWAPARFFLSCGSLLQGPGEGRGGKKEAELSLAGWLDSWLECLLACFASWRSPPPMQRPGRRIPRSAGWQEAAQDLVVSKYVTAPAARLAAQHVEGREGVTTWGPRTRREG